MKLTAWILTVGVMAMAGCDNNADTDADTTTTAAITAIAVEPVSTATNSETERFTSDTFGISFDQPASWQYQAATEQATIGANAGYWSNQPMRDPCTHGNTIKCSWPIDSLNDNALVFTWAYGSAPSFPESINGWLDQTVGEPLALDGFPAKITHSPPTDTCVPATASEIRLLAIVQTSDGFPEPVRLTACLRGPDLALLEQQLTTMLLTFDIQH